jgi:maltose O-acetyltransferase
MKILKYIKKSIKIILQRIGFLKVIKTENKGNPKFIGTRQVGNIELITIGENVSFSGDVLLYANAPIEIGDHTMIAYRVIFHTSTHDYNDHPMWTKRIDKPIKVGKHVWIGTGAIILPGIIIQDYAVIGAGSVVTANVPEGAIVAGNPARIIKYREKESYLRTMQISKWEEGKIYPGGYKSNICRKHE